MKKFLLVIALVSISFAGFAQEDAKFKAELTEFIEIQTGAGIDAMLVQFTDKIPEDKKEEFKRDLNVQLKDMYNNLADIYIEKIGKEDLTKMLNFYNTDAGKNILGKTPAIIEASSGLTQKYMSKLQPIIMKYMQQ